MIKSARQKGGFIQGCSMGLPAQKRRLAAVVFSLKAAAGAVSAALVSEWLALPGGSWVAAVSAVTVTQPDLDASLKASLLFVAANLAGAFGGAVMLEIIGQPIVAMTIGVMITGLVCYLLKQDDALRPAFVAVIIVTLFGGESGWHNLANRILEVAVGCACALIIGFLFHKLGVGFKQFEQPQKKPEE
jgi:uncharacterized membrane protein YgaE (UPF0421/DUF939 family)